MPRKKNDIEIYSTHNDGKDFIAERFIRTLKNQFISVSKMLLSL